MSLRSTGSEVIEWGGTWSEDDGGVRGCGARLGLHCGGSVRVHVCWDGQGACGSSRNELGWVRIGDSLTPTHKLSPRLLYIQYYLSSSDPVGVLLCTTSPIPVVSLAMTLVRLLWPQSMLLKLVGRFLG